MKVAVVGAGFSGLISAIYMARAGLDVDIYEEHATPGYPPHCTGLVSRWVVEAIGGTARRNTLEHYKTLTLRAGGAEAVIEPLGGVYKLDRVKLERDMLEEAQSLGAKPHLGARVEGLTQQGVIRSGGSMRRYDLVILAEGLHGGLRSRIGISYRARHLTGFNAHYTQGPELEGILVDFTPTLHQGLFAWLLRVGGEVLAGTGGPPTSAKRLLGRLEEAYSLQGRRSIYGGPVVVGPPLARPWTGRVVLVGDAAGLNKPLTGGGLYPSAKAALEAYTRIRSGVDPVEAWRKSLSGIASELRRHYVVAESLRRDPRVVEAVIRALSESGLARSLAGSIDYDHHERLAAMVAARPVAGARFLILAARHGGAKVLAAGARALLAALGYGG